MRPTAGQLSGRNSAGSSRFAKSVASTIATSDGPPDPDESVRDNQSRPSVRLLAPHASFSGGPTDLLAAPPVYSLLAFLGLSREHRPSSTEWDEVLAKDTLSQALADSLEGRDPTYPRVEASPEAFFQRCRNLRPAFFAEVFQRFTARLVSAVPPRYAAEVALVRARFAAIVILDGSRLAAIAHRLNLLWNERAVVLPGCLLGVYDLGRGLCRHLHFCADAAASEMTRAKAAGAALGHDTLILGDRLYGTADFFSASAAHRCWGVVRRNRQLSLHKVQRLRKRRVHGGLLEDWVGDAGTGVSAPIQRLRYIRWRRGGTRYELLTNML